MILAGDVGGTKTVLGLFKQAGGTLSSTREETFPSRDFSSLAGIFEEFLLGRERIHAVAVGVAGPVVDGRSSRVNLPWPVDRRRLVRDLAVDRVSVINDLEATALGIPALSPRRMHNLTPGLRARPGNAALIAAGTGLGMALLVWDGERYHASASEGGHLTFGPRNDLEIALLRFLRRRHRGRISTERVVSGDGLGAIYDFLAENGWGAPDSDLRAALNVAEDRNAAISQAGLDGSDPLAVKALEMFVSLYGAAAGDLALVARATAGVYVGGGIAPRILARMKNDEFVRAFRDKGRLAGLLEKIPVRVILEPRTALLGAAAHAARQAAGPATRRVRRKR